MKNSGNSKSVTVHRRVKTAATTDRKQAKRPAPKETVASDNSALDAAIASEKKSQGSAVKIKRSGMISHFGNTTPTKTSIGIRVTDSSSTKSSTKSSRSASSETVVMHPMLRVARARMHEHQAQGYYTQESRVKTRIESSNRMQSRRMGTTKTSTQSETAVMTAQQAKDMAIKKALASTNRATEKEEVKTHKLHFSFGRILVAMGCTAAAIFAIVYFINLNMSDFSLYAAAKQAGIETANREPRVPQEFSIANISSENGKIEINYKNSQTGEYMTISEEKSSWDSNALLNNYVRDNYSVAFTTIREQGLTIYISESNACWVNGGIVYKISAPAGSLDKKQIRQIATSM